MTTTVPDRDGAYFTGLINLAGRQRMLSQRIGLLLMIAAGGASGSTQAHAETLERAISQFEASHALIIAGRITPDAAPLALPALTTYLANPFPGDSQSVEREIKAFVGQAKAFAQRLASGEHLPVGEVAPFGARTAGAVLARIAGMIDSLGADITRILDVHARETATRREQVTHAVRRIEQAADTARMISFNARISAARAGEFGREFTALTDEIKAISDTIQSASREILAYSSLNLDAG
jgi:methyl-accepting chemotaxis protein